MQDQDFAIDRQTWNRFAGVVRSSVAGRRAALAMLLLILLLLAINGLNVVNSFVGRDFMTAIEHRDRGGFIRESLLYVLVFAASTGVAVYYRYTEERLGLRWREWLTRLLVDRYLTHPTYFRLNDQSAANGEVLNPDQRIADDVRAFTATTLSFVLMVLNGLFTILAFSGVLWSISPWLFGTAVAYAGLGSYFTYALGRPLVGLNYNQFDREADFRADLIHVRENAESVAILRREGRLKARCLHHLDELSANFRRIIEVNRNLGFFTTGYNYLIQIIPALVVAPLFISGEVEFGVITQAAIAFTHLMGAFSLVVTQFQSISSFAAVIARIGALVEGMDQAQSQKECPLQLREAADALAYERVSLRSPVDGRPLVEDLTATIPADGRLLVVGPDAAANAALFRATAGLWDTGAGRITRPEPDRIMFLPERPYLPPGTLREVLLHTGQESVVTDERIAAALAALGLEPLVERMGGLDVERPWDSILSLSEQQLIAFARLLIAAPRLAVLDRLSSALDPEQVAQLLNLLTEHAIGYVNFGEPDEPLGAYDALLELAGDGRWALRELSGGTGRAARGS
jgi:putative ATP-binding cassette transporter